MPLLSVQESFPCAVGSVTQKEEDPFEQNDWREEKERNELARDLREAVGL